MKRVSSQRASEAEAIEARAAAWLAQRDDGLTAEQEREFERWRDADPRHAIAVARLEGAWRMLEGLIDARPAGPAVCDRDLFPPARVAAPGFLLPVLAAAAAIMLLLTFVAIRGWPSRSADGLPASATQQFATTAGGYQRVTLLDGSVVELNASTEVAVSYTPAERRVRLVHGEAHFAVAKNKQRPFWVEAGGISVRAVGTAFNVRIDRSQVEVLVTEGRVRLGQIGGAAALAVPATLTPELGAGERAAVVKADLAAATIERVSDNAVRRALAWRFGPRLDFAETPLGNVVQQFNAHNHVQLELGDSALAGEPVGGSFQAENVEAFVQLLTSERDIVAERPSADRIILRKAQ
jgi:transmembrane sensor